MKDFMITFKFLIKQSFSFIYIFYNIKENKKYRNIFIIMLFVIILCLPSYILLISGLRELFKIYQVLNFQSLYIVMALFLSIFLIFFFGMFQIISYFYFSKDIKLLTPLPIKPKYYLLSKFFVIYIWELVINLFIVVPFFIIYGIYENILLYQWITMILGLLLVPFIPLVIVGFITIIIMKTTNASKNKDALRMLGYTLLIGGLIFFQLFLYSNLVPENPNEQIKLFEKLVENSSYFLEKFSIYYPITKLINLVINGTFLEATISLISFIIISIFFVYLFSMFLERVFVNSYLKEQNKSSINKKGRHKKNKIRPVSIAIAKIDFITLLKEPIYVFNTLAIVVILPVIILITSLASSGKEQFNVLFDMYSKYELQAWLIVTLFLIITSSMIPIASTTFSREGKNNWIMRSLPISSKNHIIGRIITPFFTQLLFNLIMITLIIIYLTINHINLNYSVLYGIMSLITSLIMTLPLFLIYLFVDLKRPMLKWENPQQPVKQNMNVLIAMGIGIIYGMLIFLSYQYILSYIFNNILLFIVYSIVGIILGICLYTFIKKNFNKNLINME